MHYPLIDTIVADLQRRIAKYRMNFGDEATMQDQLEQIFKEESYEFIREDELSVKDRVDFTLDCDPYILAVEVKIAGSVNAHLRQMKRYAGHEHISAVVLIATKPFDVPKTLSGKQCYCINVGNQRL